MLTKDLELRMAYQNQRINTKLLTFGFNLNFFYF